MRAVNDNNKCRAVYEETAVSHQNQAQTHEYTSVGTYSLTLIEGDYDVEIYGGGGGTIGTWSSLMFSGDIANYIGTGGSGAGFKGKLHIPAGTYTITVGSGGTSYFSTGGTGTGENGTASSISSIITAGGGNGGYASGSGRTGSGGSGGTLTVNATVVGTPEKRSNGNNGTGYRYGGASISGVQNGALSLYDNTNSGYGAAGILTGSNGTRAGIAGYVKIVVPGSTYYTYEKHYYMYN